jgi:ribosome-binding factor A
MQASRRTERVNVLLRQLLSEIIARDMKDPRLAHIITFVHVGVSKDLRYAKVYTSVLGSDKEQKSAVAALNAATGFMRRELTGRLSLKSVPHLTFIQDNSIEKGTHLLGKITDVRSDDPSVEAPADE